MAAPWVPLPQHVRPHGLGSAAYVGSVSDTVPSLVRRLVD
jgi:hypothetical protein